MKKNVTGRGTSLLEITTLKTEDKTRKKNENSFVDSVSSSLARLQIPKEETHNKNARKNCALSLETGNDVMPAVVCIQNFAVYLNRKSRFGATSSHNARRDFSTYSKLISSITFSFKSLKNIFSLSLNLFSPTSSFSFFIFCLLFYTHEKNVPKANHGTKYLFDFFFHKLLLVFLCLNIRSLKKFNFKIVCAKRRLLRLKELSSLMLFFLASLLNCYIKALIIIDYTTLKET